MHFLVLTKREGKWGIFYATSPESLGYLDGWKNGFQCTIDPILEVSKEKRMDGVAGLTELVERVIDEAEKLAGEVSEAVGNIQTAIEPLK